MNFKMLNSQLCTEALRCAGTNKHACLPVGGNKIHCEPACGRQGFHTTIEN